jgi:hypothetical protein
MKQLCFALAFASGLALVQVSTARADKVVDLTGEMDSVDVFIGDHNGDSSICVDDPFAGTDSVSTITNSGSGTMDINVTINFSAHSDTVQYWHSGLSMPTGCGTGWSALTMNGHTLTTQMGNGTNDWHGPQSASGLTVWTAGTGNDWAENWLTGTLFGPTSGNDTAISHAMSSSEVYTMQDGDDCIADEDGARANGSTCGNGTDTYSWTVVTAGCENHVSYATALSTCHGP